MVTPDFDTSEPGILPPYTSYQIQFHVDDASALLSKWIQRYENLTGSPWDNTATSAENCRKNPRNANSMIGLDRLDGLNLEDKLSSAHNLLFLWIMRYMTHVERRVSTSNASCREYRNTGERKSTSTITVPSRVLSSCKTKYDDISLIHLHTSVSPRIEIVEEYQEQGSMFKNMSNNQYYQPLSSPLPTRRFPSRPHIASSRSMVSDASMTKSAQLSVYIKTIERGGVTAIPKMRQGHQQHKNSTYRSPTNQILAYRPFSPDRSISMKGISTQSFESSFYITKSKGVKVQEWGDRARASNYNKAARRIIPFKNKDFRADPLNTMLVI